MNDKQKKNYLRVKQNVQRHKSRSIINIIQNISFKQKKSGISFILYKILIMMGSF